MSKYRKGAEAKMNAENIKIFRLPKISERDAAGKLMRIPGIVDAEAIKPTISFVASRLVANGFKTGFLDIVELRMANKPIMQNITNNLLFEL
jgi:hypothetical protein